MIDQFANTTDSVSDMVDAIEDFVQSLAVVTHHLQVLSDATSAIMGETVVKHAPKDLVASVAGNATHWTGADAIDAIDALKNLKAEAGGIEFQYLDVNAYLSANVSLDTSVTHQLDSDSFH